MSSQADNYFNSWTRVYLTYCDGAGHQGSRAEPILYKGAELFFRGQDITLARFKQLDDLLGIFKGKVTHLVISGESAGALAAFQWTNYLQEKITNATRLWSLPDSGIFIDF